LEEIPNRIIAIRLKKQKENRVLHRKKITL
jgi:hypothetical protein